MTSSSPNVAYHYLDGMQPTRFYRAVEHIPSRPEQTQLDHCYALPATRAPTSSPPPKSSSSTSSKSNSSVKYIGAGGGGARSKASRSEAPRLESLLKAPHPPQEPYLDVETPSPTPKLKYDSAKAMNMMNECAKYVSFARPADVGPDWEAAIVRTGWTPLQRALFDQILRVLHRHHLSRAATAGHPAKPVLRRGQIDASAGRIRHLLNKIGWDSKLTQWLHSVLKDHLSWEYLASYMDVLQTLRSRVPTLVDRMILLSPTHQLHSSVATQSAEALNLLLKRQWDPYTPVAKPTRYKKLKSEPVFIFVPYSAGWSCPVGVRRMKCFQSMLAGVGKPLPVHLSVSATYSLSVDEYAERMLHAASLKLQEVRHSYPSRPLFLVGWGPGGSLALKLAEGESSVAGVVCLGFPMLTLAGPRELGGLSAPTMFVVGSGARNCSLPSLQTLRSTTTPSPHPPTSLLIIQGGDEFLRVPRHRKQSLLCTQTQIDRSIVDEIAGFISSQCSASVKSTTSPQQQQQRVQRSSGRVDEESDEFEDVYEFDEAKKIPSNSSASRRKAYGRVQSQVERSVEKVEMTASLLVSQQQQQGQRVEEGIVVPSFVSSPNLMSSQSPASSLISTPTPPPKTTTPPPPTLPPLPPLIPTTAIYSRTTTQGPNNGVSSLPALIPTTLTPPPPPDLSGHDKVLNLNASEIERLNSALLSKRSTDLSTLLGSGKRVIIHKTLVKSGDGGGAAAKRPRRRMSSGEDE